MQHNSAPQSRIKSVLRHDETIIRLGGDGGGYSMTWASDDRQFVTLIDGTGWPEEGKEHYCTRMFAISGSPQDATFENLPSYPNIRLWDMLVGAATPFYGTSSLAVHDRIYQFLATSDYPFLFSDTRSLAAFRFNGAKLIYSPDRGRTWLSQYGTPVVRESRKELSRETMAFMREPQNAFSLLSFLQMGKNYSENRDGFAYVYSPNGDTDGSMNELVMFRVATESILDRGAYEYFAALKSDGTASWTRDVNLRGIVHTFPRGFGRNPMHATGWLPSIVYNTQLGVYMMVNCASGCESEENVVGVEAPLKPNYLGLWIARTPWGPWTQIHEELEWFPGGDRASRPDSAQIAPKWIADDGKSFWLTWWDGQSMRGFCSALTDIRRRAVEAGNRVEYSRLRFLWRQYHPYFALNTQRFELVME